MLGRSTVGMRSQIQLKHPDVSAARRPRHNREACVVCALTHPGHGTAGRPPHLPPPRPSQCRKAALLEHGLHLPGTGGRGKEGSAAPTPSSLLCWPLAPLHGDWIPKDPLTPSGWIQLLSKAAGRRELSARQAPPQPGVFQEERATHTSRSCSGLGPRQIRGPDRSYPCTTGKAGAGSARPCDPTDPGSPASRSPALASHRDFHLAECYPGAHPDGPGTENDFPGARKSGLCFGSHH